MIGVVSFRVTGIPQPKGSMRAFIPKGWKRPVLTSTTIGLKSWEKLVACEALRARPSAWNLKGPISISMIFHLLRPKTLVKRIVHHTRRPDVDKLIRAVLDGLTRVLFDDDAQVKHVSAWKTYVDDEPPGVSVTIRELA